MSSAHTWTVCLILSCFIHWQILSAHWASAISGTSGPQTTLLESKGHFQHTKTAFALHQLLEQTTDEKGESGANRQEQIRANYLKKIRNEINHHKFLGLGADTAHTIGNACYCFFIDKNGEFHNICLVKSSGNPIIDRAARKAICHSSQKVKRPESTGTDTIRLWVTVKYQYGL